MRKGSKLLLGGVAALACATAVFAAERDVHVLKVQLPDGSIEQIHYTGDVAPRVIVAPAQPVAIADLGDPFADMDRMFAAMDAQAGAMMRQAATLAAPPSVANAQMTRTSDGGSTAPGGSYHYSYVSSSSGANGGCTQSYEMTSYEGNQAPKVVSHQSGDCKGIPALVPTVAPEAAAAPKPGLTPTAATTPPTPPLPPTPARNVKVSKDAHAI